MNKKLTILTTSIDLSSVVNIVRDAIQTLKYKRNKNQNRQRNHQSKSSMKSLIEIEIRKNKSNMKLRNNKFNNCRRINFLFELIMKSHHCKDLLRLRLM